MRRAAQWALLAVLALPVSQASLIEDQLQTACAATGEPFVVDNCYLQYDGGQPGDAPDACPQAAPEGRVLPQQSSGLLVVVDDPVDHFAIPVPLSEVGSVLVVTMSPGALGRLTPPSEFLLTVFDPACQNPIRGFGGEEQVVAYPIQRPGSYVAQVQLLLQAPTLAGQTDGCLPMCSIMPGVNDAAGYGLGSSFA